MQSWSLGKFVKDEGLDKAVRVWGVSRQAVEYALKVDRAIQITLIDGFYEVHESKTLAITPESQV